LEELAKELESNLELVTIIGLRDKLAEGVHEVVELFNDIDSHIWVASGDIKENVMNCV